MNQKNKKILIIAVAAFACVIIALGVMLTLKKVAPRDIDNKPTPTELVPQDTAETRLKKEADSTLKAAEEAFNNRNTAEAIAKFTAAKTLYEQAGDTLRAEQMADRIAVAEHEATKNPESEPQKAPANPAPSEDGIGGEAAKASSEN